MEIVPEQSSFDVIPERNDGRLLPGVKATLGQFAQELALSRDVLRRVLSEQGVTPVATTSKGDPIYALHSVFRAWRREQSGDSESPHTRLAAARAQEVENRVKAQRGELVDIGDVERLIGTLCMTVSRAFESALDNVERELGIDGPILELIEKQFDECREVLAAEFARNASGRE